MLNSTPNSFSYLLLFIPQHLAIMVGGSEHTSKKSKAFRH